MRNIHLRSFFDFVFLLKFKCYIRAAAKRAHVVTRYNARNQPITYTINSRPLLLLAIDDHDNAMAGHFLKLGADPNVKSYGIPFTVWHHVLEQARSEQDVDEQMRLCELVLALLKYNADISLLQDGDFDTLLFDLERTERDDLAARVEATRPKVKPRKHDSATPSSPGVRGSVKHRFSKIFKGKVKSSKHI